MPSSSASARSIPRPASEYVGVVGNRFEAEAAGIAHLWVGEIADVTRAARRSRPASTGSSSAPAPSGRSTWPRLLEPEQQGGPEVVVHAGLPGIDASRITVSAVANEALLRVAPSTPSLAGRFVKRAFDIVVAGALLLVAAPVFALVAILVKREDGGPVLFRQQRVGRDGVEFGMVKFRTMVVDAEARLAAVQADNQRSGPLFKLAVDPRVTRIGHILRRTSLDELPQLLNVLKGEMSLVGPRPALQREVDEFPAELHARHQVRPGITGLWQVEARDNPAFDAYQRLDLFYVANTSLLLDVVVLLGTAEQMLLRPFQSRRRGEMIVTVAGELDGRGAVVRRSSLIRPPYAGAQARERSSARSHVAWAASAARAIGVGRERGVELPALGQPSRSATPSASAAR